MFPTLTDIYTLVDDAKNYRVSKVLRDAAAIQIKVADTLDLFLDPTAPKGALSEGEREDIHKQIGVLRAAKADFHALELEHEKGADPDKKITPTEIVLIINTIVAILQKIHDWRHPKPDPVAA